MVFKKFINWSLFVLNFYFIYLISQKSVSYFLLVILVFIMIIGHELSHALIAWLINVPIKEVTIGFGEKILNFGEIIRINIKNLCLLGGYVGVDGKVLHQKETKLLFWLAGPLFNLVFSLLLVCISLIWENQFSFMNLLALLKIDYIVLIKIIKFLLFMGFDVKTISGYHGGLKIIIDQKFVILNWAAIISFLLALLNLLPFPGTDGFKILANNIMRLNSVSHKAIKTTIILINSYFFIFIGWVIIKFYY